MARNDNVMLFRDEKTLGLVFEALRQEAKYCDVTITIRNRQIHGHKIILQSNIPYFKVIFSSDAVKEERHHRLTINEDYIDPDVFNKLITFIYTGELEVEAQNVESLFLCAYFLELGQVFQVCIEYFNRQSDFPCNLNYPLTLTILIAWCRINGKCGELILKNFVPISFSMSFKQLTFEGIVDLVSSDELNVTSELDVFNAIINWIKHDVETRKILLSKLLFHVRLHLITDVELINIVEKNELIEESQECWQIIDSVKNYHLTLNSDHLKGFKTFQRQHFNQTQSISHQKKANQAKTCANDQHNARRLARPVEHQNSQPNVITSQVHQNQRPYQYHVPGNASRVNTPNYNRRSTITMPLNQAYSSVNSPANRRYKLSEGCISFIVIIGQYLFVFLKSTFIGMGYTLLGLGVGLWFLTIMLLNILKWCLMGLGYTLLGTIKGLVCIAPASWPILVAILRVMVHRVSLVIIVIMLAWIHGPDRWWIHYFTEYRSLYNGFTVFCAIVRLVICFVPK